MTEACRAWHGRCRFGRRTPKGKGTEPMRRRDFLASATAAAASVLPVPYIRSAAAQSRKDTLLAVSETGPNSLDLMMPGANISCYEIGWNNYDRLTTFG